MSDETMTEVNDTLGDRDMQNIVKRGADLPQESAAYMQFGVNLLLAAAR